MKLIIIAVVLGAGAYWCVETGVFQTMFGKASGTYGSSVERNREMM